MTTHNNILALLPSTCTLKNWDKMAGESTLRLLSAQQRNQQVQALAIGILAASQTDELTYIAADTIRLATKYETALMIAAMVRDGITDSASAAAWVNQKLCIRHYFEPFYHISRDRIAA